MYVHTSYCIVRVQIKRFSSITTALPCAIFATQFSSQAVYFIQTGSNPLSNTY